MLVASTTYTITTCGRRPCDEKEQQEQKGGWAPVSSAYAHAEQQHSFMVASALDQRVRPYSVPTPAGSDGASNVDGTRGHLMMTGSLVLNFPVLW